MKNKEETYVIFVMSDDEFWNIVYAMPTGSYTCITNLTEGYTRALYVNLSK